MSETPPESDTYMGRLQNSLLEFSQCVGTAVEVCSWGLTIGETYVPFDPDEDEAEECPHDEEDDFATCSQVWVRVENITPKTAPEPGLAARDYYYDSTITLEVGILRCIEVPEGGEAPRATDVMSSAFLAMEDMNDLLCAAMGCEVWESIEVGTWTPSGPLGGQYGGIWTFTVEPR